MEEEQSPHVHFAIRLGDYDMNEDDRMIVVAGVIGMVHDVARRDGDPARAARYLDELEDAIRSTREIYGLPARQEV